MPISSTENRRVYAGNGATTAFPFPYYFLASTDLVVLKTETATGAAIALVLDTDYTITGAADPNGGTVTITPAPASGYKITIYRDPPATQEVDFEDNDKLPAASLELPVDKLTMIVQRLKELGQRALRLPDGDVTGIDTELAPSQAGKYLRVNVAGTGFDYGTPVAGAVVSAAVGVEGISPRASQVQVDTGTEVAAHVTPQTLANSALAGRVSTAEADIQALETDVAALETEVSFSAHKNGTDQTGIVTATDTKLTFTTEAWDNGGYYDAANSRFTPPAGTYLFSSCAFMNAGAVDQQLISLLLFKNGVLSVSGNRIRASGTGSQSPALCALAVANGTDYFEIWISAAGAGDKTVSGAATSTYFQAVKVA